MSSIEFRLRRSDVNTSWGFRLQGGQDVRQPLTVQRVFNGSPADGNLQRGDVLLSINNNDVSGGYLKSAEELVRGSGNSLTVVVRRTGQPVNSSQPYDDLPSQQPAHRAFDSSPSKYIQQSVTSSHHSQSQQHQANVWRPTQQSQHPTVDVYSNHSGGSDYPHSVTSPSGGSAVSPAAGATAGYQSVKTPWSADSRQQQQQRPAGFGQQWSSSGQQHDNEYQAFSPQQSVQHGGGVQNYAAKQISSPSSGPAPQQSRQVQGQDQGQGSRAQPQPDAEDDDYEVKSVRDIKKMFNQKSKPLEFGPKHSERKPGPWHDDSQSSKKTDFSTSGSWNAAEPSAPRGSSSLLPKRQQPTSTISHSTRMSFSPPSSVAAAGQANTSGIYDYPPPRQEPAAMGSLNRSTMSKPVTAQTKPGAGYSYQGIVTVTPAKTVHSKNSSSGGQSGQQAGKKKEFDPSQSLVYQMLQEENERKKRGEVDAVDEEDAAASRPQRQQQQQQQQFDRAGRGGGGGAGGAQHQQQQQRSSRLQDLLERDQAQTQQQDEYGSSGRGQQQQQPMSAKTRREMSPSYPRHQPGHDSSSAPQATRQRQHQPPHQQQQQQQPGPAAVNHHHQHQQNYYQQPAAPQQMYSSMSSGAGYDGYGMYGGGGGGGYQSASASGYDGGYNSMPMSDF